MLMSNQEYQNKNYQKALEETFVKIDYMLLSEKKKKKMRKIVLE